MISLVEILALVTLGGFAVIVARKRFRRGSALALVLTGLCALAMVSGPPAAATEVRKGQTAEVRKDENIKGNVYLSGERVEVEGTVDGDVYAAGKDIEIDGHVTGDLISAGRSVWIRGQLDGNVRSAGNNLNVIGIVGKNISFFGDTIRIDEKGVVNGSVMMFGSDMNIEGRLGRDILFMGDRINLNGVVGGSIDVKGAGLEIGSRAQVDGPIRFEGENEAIVSSGAKLASPVQFKKHVHKKEEFGRTSAFWTCVLLIAFASYGMVLFLAVPNFAQESVQSAENIGASLGLGLLVFFGVLIGSIIAMCTLIGLFVGFSSLFVWLIAVYAAQPVVGALIGQWILGRSKETWPLIGRMMLGLFIIRIATLLPHIGWLIKLGVVLWGLGAISLALYRRYQPAIPGQAPYVPPSVPLTPLTPAGGATAV